MKRILTAAVFTLLIGAVLSAQAVQSAQTPQSNQDLSGRWSRDPSTASGGADGAGWGPQIEIKQSGVNVTVQPGSGMPSRFRLDGIETAEALSVDGCKNTIRITKAVTNRDRVTITTWIVEKPGCVHREDEDDPLINSIGVVAMDKVFGRRKLESISDVYRQGNVLTVETTRSVLGELTNTSTTYRK
jgi:hypothetical protein